MSAQWDTPVTAPEEGDVLQSTPRRTLGGWAVSAAIVIIAALIGFGLGRSWDNGSTTVGSVASPVPVTAGPVEISQPLDVGDWRVSYVSVAPWAGGAVVQAHVVNKGDHELLDGKFTLTLITRATGATVATLQGEAYFVDPGKGGDVVFFPTQVVAADAYADLVNGGPPYGYRIAVQL